MNRNFISVMQLIGHHGKILWKGFLRMVYGAMTAGLIALAVYGFCMITTESGWAAVCDFIAAVATAVLALACMYIMGGKKGAKR